MKRILVTALLGWVRVFGGFGLLALVLLALAAIVAPFGIHEHVSDSSFRHVARPATGLVTRQVRGDRQADTTVTVTFPVHGHTFSFTENVDGNYHVDGHHIAVLYDPADPSHAELADDGVGERIIAFEFFVTLCSLAVVSLLVGAVLAAVRRVTRRPPRAPTFEGGRRVPEIE